MIVCFLRTAYRAALRSWKSRSACSAKFLMKHREMWPWSWGSVHSASKRERKACKHDGLAARDCASLKWSSIFHAQRHLCWKRRSLRPCRASCNCVWISNAARPHASSRWIGTRCSDSDHLEQVIRQLPKFQSHMCLRYAHLQKPSLLQRH